MERIKLGLRSQESPPFPARILSSLPLYEVVTEVLLGTHPRLGSCLNELAVLVEDLDQAFRRTGGVVSLTEYAHDVNHVPVAINDLFVEPL